RYLGRSFLRLQRCNQRASIDDFTEHLFLRQYARAYPNIESDRAKFTKLLRDHYAILGPMGMPGIDVGHTRFGVDLKKKIPKITDFDLADLIYKIHRCSHGHGDELLTGFELIPNAAGPDGKTHFCSDLVNGTVQLSDRVIFGMLGVVVFSPVNSHQKSDYGYFLSYDGVEFKISDWWGRAEDFLKIVKDAPKPIVTIYEYISDDPAPVRARGELHIKI
ncbi:hypothetical protein, partial [Pseudomonas syringae group genomosp. 3]|uniref:hypothetical protein n=2 Tax=Pseudomonas syringae group genomosp. 3 TaxID=251701 RepID=UPI000AAC7B0E